MIRITLALTGALAALAFSAATAPADPDAPTPIAGTDSAITQSDGPWFEQLQYSQDFSVLNAPDETFEGVVRLDTNDFGLDDRNVSVVQDISGNVPIGEQYKRLHLFRQLGRGLQQHRRYAGSFLHHAVR